MSSTVSFELVVVSVENLLVECHRPAVLVQFLHFSHLYISPQRQSSENDSDDLAAATRVQSHGLGRCGRDKKIVPALAGCHEVGGRELQFGSGKSCLFQMDDAELRKQMDQLPVYCLLVDENQDPVTLLGWSTLPVAPHIANMFDSTHSVTKEVHQQPILDMMGCRVACLNARWRLTRLDPTMNCHLHQYIPASRAYSAPDWRNETSEGRAPHGGVPPARIYTNPSTSKVAKQPKAMYTDGPIVEEGACRKNGTQLPVANEAKSNTGDQKQTHPMLFETAPGQVGMHPGRTQDVSVEASDAGMDIYTKNEYANQTLSTDTQPCQRNSQQTKDLLSQCQDEYRANIMCPPPMLYTQRASCKSTRQGSPGAVLEDQDFLVMAQKLGLQSHQPPATADTRTSAIWQDIASRSTNNHPINHRKAESQPPVPVATPTSCTQQSVCDDQKPQPPQDVHQVHLGISSPTNGMLPSKLSAATGVSPAPVLEALLHELNGLLRPVRGSQENVSQNTCNCHVPERSSMTIHGRHGSRSTRQKVSNPTPLFAQSCISSENSHGLPQLVFAHLVQRAAAAADGIQSHSSNGNSHQLPAIPDKLAAEASNDSAVSGESQSSTTFLPAPSSNISPRQPIGRWKDEQMPQGSNGASDSTSPPISARRKKLIRRRSSAKLSAQSACTHLGQAPNLQEPKLAAPQLPASGREASPVPAPIPTSSINSLEIPRIAHLADNRLSGNVSDSSTCLPKVLVFLPSHTDTGGSGGGAERNNPPKQPQSTKPDSHHRPTHSSKVKRRKSLLDAWSAIAATSSAVSGDSDPAARQQTHLPRPLATQKSTPATERGDQKLSRPPLPATQSVHGQHTSNRPTEHVSTTMADNGTLSARALAGSSIILSTSPTGSNDHETHNTSQTNKLAENMPSSQSPLLSPSASSSPLMPSFQLLPQSPLLSDSSTSERTSPGWQQPTLTGSTTSDATNVDYEGDLFEESTASSVSEQDSSSTVTDDSGIRRQHVHLLQTEPAPLATPAETSAATLERYETCQLASLASPQQEDATSTYYAEDHSSSTYDINTEDIVISDDDCTSISFDKSQNLSGRSLSLMGEEPDLQVF